MRRRRREAKRDYEKQKTVCYGDGPVCRGCNDVASFDYFFCLPLLPPSFRAVCVRVSVTAYGGGLVLLARYPWHFLPPAASLIPLSTCQWSRENKRLK
jgi:hypothetical protein